MKLYTEEQVKQAIAYYNIEKFVTTDELLKDLKLTPIELPSDKEIIKNAPTIPKNADDYLITNKIGFVQGAKWMRDKILKQSE